MPNDARLYAIGDVHGHYDALSDLMDRLIEGDMDPERDTVIFLGDYVDRGHQSAQVVRLMQVWMHDHPHWRALRGNHEQMMLDAMRNGPEDWGTWTMWWYQGGRETAASFARKPVSETEPRDAIECIPDSVLEWIDSLPTAHVGFDGERYGFVHAGFAPGPRWKLTSNHDRMWIRDEFLESDFDFGFGRVIVHGHTPVEAPVVRPNRIGIDTILKTGRLTAVELSGDEPRFIQSGGK